MNSNRIKWYMVGFFGDILLPTVSLQLSGERAVASEIVHERIFTNGSTHFCLAKNTEYEN